MFIRNSNLTGHLIFVSAKPTSLCSLPSSNFNALHIVIIKKINKIVVRTMFDLTSTVQNAVLLFVMFWTIKNTLHQSFHDPYALKKQVLITGHCAFSVWEKDFSFWVLKILQSNYFPSHWKPHLKNYTICLAGNMIKYIKICKSLKICQPWCFVE